MAVIKLPANPAPTMYNSYLRRIFVSWDKSCALAGHMCFQGVKLFAVLRINIWIQGYMFLIGIVMFQKVLLYNNFSKLCKTAS